jgi:hypothetical protein
MTRPLTASSAKLLGAIQAEAIYPLPEFQRLTGLGEAAMRKARRMGLVVTSIGRRRYVTGKNFYEFIARAGERVQGDSVTASFSRIGGADA